MGLSKNVGWDNSLKNIYCWTVVVTFLKWQTNISDDEEVEREQSSSSWLGLLKYSLFLLVPGFLNHAALFREGDVLRPPGQSQNFNPINVLLK